MGKRDRVREECTKGTGSKASGSKQKGQYFKSSKEERIKDV